MQIFLVGGAVRDKLLGLEPRDLDYVVVGSTEAELLQQGFTRVGLNFPVFLHPETGEEYALARREKKIAPGYSGFEVEFGKDVTLEEDLGRRDLTINSIAQDMATGQFIDPYNGIHDLTAGILRHTSNAFQEDPLRVIRLARFVARYNFEVASETIELCKAMVKSHELHALVPDRIWAEMAKMLHEDHFVKGMRFLQEVDDCSGNPLFSFMFDAGITYKEDGPGSSSMLRDFLMTPTEKAFFFLSINEVPKIVQEASRIPADLRRKLQMFQRALEVFVDPSPAAFIRFFDSFRNDLQNEGMKELIHFFIVQKQFDGKDWIMHDFGVAIKKLSAMDFTELVKDVAPRDIKQFVFDAKMKEIT